MASVIARTSVLVSGSSGAGKTALISRIVDNIWAPVTKPTIGVVSHTDVMNTSGVALHIKYLDTSGQDKVHSACPQAYRGVCAVVLVVDMSYTSNPDAQASHWRDMAYIHAGPEVPVLLVANKTDLVDGEPGTLNFDLALEKHGLTELERARYYQNEVFYTSAKDGDGIPTLRQALKRISKMTLFFLRAVEIQAKTLDVDVGANGVVLVAEQKDGSKLKKKKKRVKKYAGKKYITVVADPDGHFAAQRGKNLIEASQQDPLWYGLSDTVIESPDASSPSGSLASRLRRRVSPQGSTPPGCAC